MMAAMVFAGDGDGGEFLCAVVCVSVCTQPALWRQTDLSEISPFIYGKLY